MLTTLTVNGETYDAVGLLALMQQAWPTQAKPAGEGTFKDPWKLQTAAEWFWAAKRIASFTRVHKFEAGTQTADTDSTQFFFNIAGRYISIQAVSLYARDHGEVPLLPPKGAPKKLNTMEISYTGIYEKMLAEHSPFDNGTVAISLRQVLLGNQPEGESSALRLLASVMFLSEVARNHTAFHTGLMLLDLIEARISIDASNFAYDFKNALWSPTTMDAILANKNIANKADRVPVPNVAGESNAMSIAASGGEAQLSAQMGMGVMSHVFSESGGAFDLTGKGVFQAPANKQGAGARWQDPASSLTYVRRKEATLLIRWLAAAIAHQHPGTNVAIGDGGVAFDTSGAYSFVSQAGDLPTHSSMALSMILPLIDQRVTSLAKMT